MADELETLNDFVSSEGFHAFSEHVKREWGPSGLRFQHGVREAASGKDGAVEALQLVLKVQEEVIALMSWPNQRLDYLKNQRKQALMNVTPSRRGPGL